MYVSKYSHYNHPLLTTVVRITMIVTIMARVQILLMKLSLHLGHQPLFVMTQAELGTFYTIQLELTGKEKRVRNWVYAFMLTMV